MITLVALYRRPPEPEEFDRHFTEVHLPLLRQFPGLRALDVLRVTGAPIGESKFHVLVQASFDSRAAMDAALASREGKAVARDLMMFAADLVTVFHGEPAV
jgi:uncharacterized protein (TIGR02118 family)